MRFMMKTKILILLALIALVIPLKAQEEDTLCQARLMVMYELTYRVILKDAAKTKEFLDELRCRNGNLTISCGKAEFKEAL